MVNLKTTNKDLANVPKKYCRLVVTEDQPNWHRLVETKEGLLEYRMGAGKWEEMTSRKFRTFLRSIVQAAKAHQIEFLAIALPEFSKLQKYGAAWTYSTFAENLLMAAYEFKRYKSDDKKKPGKELQEILICGGMTTEETAGFARGQVVGTYIKTARDIANTTGDHMTPSLMAKVAQETAKGTEVKVSVLDKAKIKSLKMGLLEAVGKGASDGPKFIVMEYFPLGKPSKRKAGSGQNPARGTDKHDPVVFIGKGITYDTGGLNVKPVGGLGAMQDMYMDMSGGAAVIAAVAAIAKLGLKVNVVGLIPAAENAVSDRAMRAGDIVTAMNGKTVEVLHTDAEGRMVLADALTYAQKFYSPRSVIDCATLTGASLVALGQHTSALMTRDEKFQVSLLSLGEESGDLCWPLPLWSEYEEGLKSDRADYTNVNKGYARWGGTIEAGIFLSFFAPENVPWAHLDTAPRLVSSGSDKLAKGATGEPVRLLIKYAETQQ